MDGLMRRSSTSARAASFRSSRRNASPCRGWKRALPRRLAADGAPLLRRRKLRPAGAAFFARQPSWSRERPARSAYPAMLRALEAPMPDDVPQFRTTFAGTRQDPAERAVLSGLDEENFAPVPLLHALLRGMADELSACYRATLKAGCAPAGRLLWGSGQRSAAQSRPAACRREELWSAAHAGCRPGGGRLRRGAVCPYAA